MSNLSFDQFIYGKFTDSMGEYQVIACTENLMQFEFDSILKRYRFWGSTPPEGKHEAVGIFPYEDKVILVQVQAPKMKLERYFYQYRYVFIPVSDLVNLRYRIFKLLQWLSVQTIPVKERPNLWGKSTKNLLSLEPMKFPLWSDISLDQEREKETDSIIECLKEKDTDSQSFLLQAISLLLNNSRLKQRLLISDVSGKLAAASYYLPSICLLLPAIYRYQISIAVGNVDLDSCSWTQLIIKQFNTNPINAKLLPQDCIWLDRSRSVFNNLTTSDYLESKYTKALLKYFTEQSDERQKKAITQLLKDLDQEKLDTIFTNSSWGDLVNNPNRILQEIPSLGDNRTELLKAFEEYGLTNITTYIDQRCNLQNDSPEFIRQKIQGWKPDSPIVQFIITLLAENGWDCRQDLPQFNKLTEVDNGLSLTSVIEYAETIPDPWKNINNTARKLFPNHQERLEFFNQVLGCSAGCREKFLLPVLYEWLISIAQDYTLKEKFIQENNLAWQCLLKQPSMYIENLFQLDYSQDNFKLAIKSLINCLSALPEQQIHSARDPVLRKLVSEQFQPASALEASNYQDYIDLIVEIAKTGMKHSFQADEWGIIAPIVLHFYFPVDDANKVAVTVTNTDNQLNKDDYKKYSIASAKKIAEDVESKEQTFNLLEKCKIFKLEKEEFIDIGEVILSNFKEKDPSIIHGLLAKFSDSDLEIYKLPFSANFMSLLSQARVKIQPSSTCVSDQFSEEGLEKSLFFFVEFLNSILSRKDYESLKQWKELMSTSSPLYDDDFKKAAEHLEETHTVNFFIKSIQWLKKEDLQRESDILEERLYLYKDEKIDLLSKEIKSLPDTLSEKITEKMAKKLEEFKTEFLEEFKNFKETLIKEYKKDREEKNQGDQNHNPGEGQLSSVNDELTTDPQTDGKNINPEGVSKDEKKNSISAPDRHPMDLPSS